LFVRERLTTEAQGKREITEQGFQLHRLAAVSSLNCQNPVLAFEIPLAIFPYMSSKTAFQRGVSPLLQLLLPGREDAVLAVQTDQPLRERIDELAAKNTEGALSSEEREEYAGYVRANKFVAVLRREAKKFKSGSAA
jgi:hypothetical protein